MSHWFRYVLIMPPNYAQLCASCEIVNANVHGGGACLKVAAMEAWTCKRAEESKEGRVWSARRPRWILDGEFTWERQGGDEGDVWFEHEKREGRFERFVKKARRR